MAGTAKTFCLSYSKFCDANFQRRYKKWLKNMWKLTNWSKNLRIAALHRCLMLQSFYALLWIKYSPCYWSIYAVHYANISSTTRIRCSPPLPLLIALHISFINQWTWVYILIVSYCSILLFFSLFDNFRILPLAFISFIKCIQFYTNTIHFNIYTYMYKMHDLHAFWCEMSHLISHYSIFVLGLKVINAKINIRISSVCK